ncbi:hypothetical protein BC943DRAFT_351418 [Umbelopsis sp. AD052]|nr:hypothetical protein BC943DRAFT_351418 [Umbelopsis sp. AD052]
MSLSARSYDTYGQQSSRSFGNKSSVVDLQKSIREQKILLSALQDAAPVAADNDIESLKRRIATVDKQIHGGDSRLKSSKPELLLSRYSSRMRQLSDLADHQRSMRKEIDFTLNTTIKDLEKQLLRETEKLNEKEQELARIRDSKASGSTNTSLYNPSMTEADRIRSKAQAMIAARLNKTSYVESAGAESKKVELAIEERDCQLQRQMAKLDDLRHDLRKALEASIEASDLERNEKQLKEQRMFEDGLFVSEELSDFIDSIRRDRAKKAYGPPPATPPLPRQYSPAPPPLPASKYVRPSRPAAPPPIPTSLRPETPRSAEAIKAEAHRRIDEKRMSLQTLQPMTPPAADPAQESKQLEDEQHKQQLLEAEKAAQAKLREAERLAHIRLAEFNKRKEEAETSRLAAEEEERRLKEEAERLALEEEQERLERERVEKEKKAEEEQRLIQEEREKERQRIEQEKQKIEREEKEAIERQKKLEEENRAAEKAKEEEAERLRRAQEELERAKEAAEARQREVEAAERERQRLEIEKAAAEKRRQDELDRQQREAAAEEERQKLAAAEEEKKQQMMEQVKEEGIWSTDLNREERRTRNSTDFSQAKHFPTSFSFDSKPSPLAKETSDDDSESEYATDSESEVAETNTTAGTAGFGTDLDDEVDFRTIYRVKALYDYLGTRPDDLSFAEDEIVKAHPSKDTDSDWWYGTSLKTNNCGFFPRTYCEVVEKAFKVKTLYEFKGVRDDDLSFEGGQTVTCQPFQDQDSEWWFGTSDATNEAGYFPRTYVEVIEKKQDSPDRKDSVPDIIVHQPKPQHNIPMLDNRSLSPPITLSPSRSTPTNKTAGRSAPSSPVIHSANLRIGRRRAASNASVLVSGPISAPSSVRSGSPIIVRPDSPNVLNTWANTMDEKELLNVTPEERKRQEAIYELIVTERTYLRDLQLIVNVFYASSGQYISPDAQNIIFSNVEDLLLCNTGILSDLEDREREGANFVSAVGDIFLNHAENLKCYQTYCRNQSAASRFLQKKRDEDKVFATFLKSCQSRPECRSLDLSSFLLEPMQRITRYPLLLRQILHSTPKYHHDYSMVADAIEKAEEVLKDVNEAARKHENKQKLSELSRLVDLEGLESIERAGREFMMEGPLYKAKSGRKLHACLFNDMLILAQPIRGLSPQGYLYTLYKEPMPTDRIQVRGSAKLGTDDTGFQIVYGDLVVSVKAATVSMKKQWMTRISQASSVLSASRR